MWEKWVFIATAAGITCLMRASIGDILKAGGGELTVQLFHECASIAGKQALPPARSHWIEAWRCSRRGVPQ
jgi:2-dehydropantoate 2-reductase